MQEVPEPPVVSSPRQQFIAPSDELELEHATRAVIVSASDAERLRIRLMSKYSTRRLGASSVDDGGRIRDGAMLAAART
jgi:hypothetical protein